MNKHEFLSKLQERISLLEDAEQKDIIDEYSQHIDIKIATGMTEAEAIADFGPIDELVEGILSAYHVKASAVSKQPKPDVDWFISGGRQAAETAVDATKKGYLKIRDKAHEFKQQRASQSVHTPRNADNVSEKTTAPETICADEDTSNVAADTHVKMHRPIGHVATSIVRGGEAAGSKAWQAGKTLLRWCWNFCVACFVLLAGICSLLAVFTFGFCLLLLLQGYPLAGITIAALGATVALVCATFLAARLIITKHAKETSENRGPSSTEHPHNPSPTSPSSDGTSGKQCEGQLNVSQIGSIAGNQETAATNHVSEITAMLRQQRPASSSAASLDPHSATSPISSSAASPGSASIPISGSAPAPKTPPVFGSTSVPKTAPIFGSASTSKTTPIFGSTSTPKQPRFSQMR